MRAAGCDVTLQPVPGFERHRIQQTLEAKWDDDGFLLPPGEPTPGTLKSREFFVSICFVFHFVMPILRLDRG